MTKEYTFTNVEKQKPKLLFLFRMHVSISTSPKDALGIQVMRLLRYISHSRQEGHRLAKTRYLHQFKTVCSSNRETTSINSKTEYVKIAGWHVHPQILFMVFIYLCITCLYLEKHKLSFVSIISMGNNGAGSSVICCLTPVS